MSLPSSPEQSIHVQHRLGLLFAGVGALAVLSAVLLILIPGDPENAWFLGFSRTRAMVLAGLLSVVPASYLVFRLHVKLDANRLLETLQSPAVVAGLLLACQLVFAGSVIIMLRLVWVTDTMARGLLLREVPLLFFTAGLAVLLSAWTLLERPGWAAWFLKQREWRLVQAGMLLALLLPIAYTFRMVALDDFVTTDEVLWAAHAANFNYGLQTGNYAITNQLQHPGVTTMWAGALAARDLFPDYVEVVGEEIGPGKMANLHLRQGLPRQSLIAAGRAWVITINVLVLGVVLVYLQRLFGFPTALFCGLLLACDPFFIAHSRLLQPDSFLGAWMLLSICAALAFTRQNRRADLLLSGAAAGMSWLTKSPGFFLVPIVGALLFFRKPLAFSLRPILQRLTDTLWQGLQWSLVGALVFAVLWPAVLVEPLAALGDVFGQAFEYAAIGHAGPVFFNGQIYPDGRIPALSGFYPLALAWRTTPVVLLGLGLSILALLRKDAAGSSLRKGIGAFWLSLLIFILLTNLGSKKFDRYILPAFPLAALAAGLGWIWFQGKLTRLGRAAVLLPLFLAFVQLAAAWGSRPYYLTYYNPLLGGTQVAKDVMMVGWGEGLNEAAGYLAGQTGAGRRSVASFYSDGSFSYFFPGDSISIPTTAHVEPAVLDQILGADYVVLYHQQIQRGTPVELLAFLEDKSPEYRVTIDGLDYVQVFKMKEP